MTLAMQLFLIFMIAFIIGSAFISIRQSLKFILSKDEVVEDNKDDVKVSELP